MKRWMVDIESLGDQPGGVILSIGWVRFSQERVYMETAREVRIDIGSCFESGLRVSADTINFWLEQSGKPWADGADPVRLDFALADFCDDVKMADELWAKPPSYDVSAIRHALECCDMHATWSHRAETCLRTLLRMMPSDWKPPERADMVGHHSALSDAIHQAEVCAAALRSLRTA